MQNLDKKLLENSDSLHDNGVCGYVFEAIYKLRLRPHGGSSDDLAGDGWWVWSLRDTGTSHENNSIDGPGKQNTKKNGMILALP